MIVKSFIKWLKMSCKGDGYYNALVKSSIFMCFLLIEPFVNQIDSCRIIICKLCDVFTFVLFSIIEFGDVVL